LTGVNGGFLEVEPGVGLTVQRKLQLFPQRLAALVVFQDALLDVVQTHAGNFINPEQWGFDGRSGALGSAVYVLFNLLLFAEIGR